MYIHSAAPSVVYIHCRCLTSSYSFYAVTHLLFCHVVLRVVHNIAEDVVYWHDVYRAFKLCIRSVRFIGILKLTPCMLMVTLMFPINKSSDKREVLETHNSVKHHEIRRRTFFAKYFAFPLQLVNMQHTWHLN